MSIAYFNCPSGVAGDMILGAFLDTGLPLKHLRRELAKLSLNGYRLVLKKSARNKIRGLDFRVEVEKSLRPVSVVLLNRILEDSKLHEPVKNLSLEILRRILAVQHKVFDLKKDEVYFDGAQAVDVLVDVAGAAIGFDFFRFKEVYASPLPIHRCFSEDVIETLKGIPLEKTAIPHPLVTITGVSILKTVVKHFGESPLHKITKTGTGLGDLNVGKANVLQIHIGEGFPVLQLEANIDDMNPQWFDFVLRELFSIGVVDVALQPIQMKKNRLGTLLKVLAPWDLKEEAIRVILRETTTTGVRYFPVERRILKREMKTLTTRFGKLPVKLAKDGPWNIEKWIPEYEACRKVAQKRKIPLREVYEEIRRCCHLKN